MEGIKVLKDIGNSEYYEKILDELSNYFIGPLYMPDDVESRHSKENLAKEIRAYNNILTQCIVNLCNNNNFDDEFKRKTILEIFESKLGFIKIDVEIFDVINEYFTYDELRELVKNTKNSFYIHCDKFNSNEPLVYCYLLWEIDMFKSRREGDKCVRIFRYGRTISANDVVDYLSKCEIYDQDNNKKKVRNYN